MTVPRTARPILFKGEMVRAILGGRKTQTRRLVKAGPRLTAGNRLWVKETHYCDDGRYADPHISLARAPVHDHDRLLASMYYRADGECCEQIPECCCDEVGKPKWRPSIHMPRWASRITLEVKAVRVESLQDITEKDAVLEGFERREHFIRYWDSVSKHEFRFDANSWVWVIDFERVDLGYTAP